MPDDRIATERAVLFLPAEYQRALKRREYRARLDEASLAMVVCPEGFAIRKADGRKADVVITSPAEAQAMVIKATVVRS